MSVPRVLIYLLRRDLRIADNPILHEISKTFQQSPHPYTHLLPVYVFAAQQIEVSGFLSSDSDRSPFPEARSNVAGFWRCGPHRAKFLAESVWDLKKSLGHVGSGLEIRVGMVGQVVKEMLDAFQKESTEVVGVWMTSEEGVEEKREEQDVRRAAEGGKAEFKLWTDEKYYVDEWDSQANFPSRKLTLPKPRSAVQKAGTPPRCLHNLPQTSGTPPRSTPPRPSRPL
jgi:deoxyribodipyrimidine photo-lyase